MDPVIFLTFPCSPPVQPSTQASLSSKSCSKERAEFGTLGSCPPDPFPPCWHQAAVSLVSPGSATSLLLPL